MCGCGQGMDGSERGWLPEGHIELRLPNVQPQQREGPMPVKTSVEIGSVMDAMEDLPIEKVLEIVDYLIGCVDYSDLYLQWLKDHRVEHVLRIGPLDAVK